jgi:rhodanese-related sulfurtransferase
MKNNEGVRPGPAGIVPPSITAVELRRHIGTGEKPTLVDVREAGPFAARHIAGSIHSPDSQTTALVRKMQTLKRALLVCEDGRVSAMVARTLGFCGFHEVAYLEGGLEAWSAVGGVLVETTRSGFEHELPRPEPPEPAPAPKPGFAASFFSVLLGRR